MSLCCCSLPGCIYTGWHNAKPVSCAFILAMRPVLSLVEHVDRGVHSQALGLPAAVLLIPDDIRGCNSGINDLTSGWQHCVPADDPARIFATGADLLAAEKDELSDMIERCTVFAKVTPQQKMAIVAGLQKNSHIVGFLGDGTNDALALCKADVGVSVDSGVLTSLHIWLTMLQ